MSSTANWTVTGVCNLTNDTFIATKRLKTVATSGDYNDLINTLPITSTTTVTTVPNNLTLSNPDDTTYSGLFGIAKVLNNYFGGTAIGDLAIRATKGRLFIGVNGLTNAAPSLTIATDGSITQRPTNFTMGMTATTGTFNTLTANGAAILPQVNSDWNATSGAAQVLNKPTILPQVNSDWNATSGVAQILNRPGNITNAAGSIVSAVNCNGAASPGTGTSSILWNLQSGSGNMTFLNNAPNSSTGGWDWQQFVAGSKVLTTMSLTNNGYLTLPGTVTANGATFTNPVTINGNTIGAPPTWITLPMSTGFSAGGTASMLPQYCLDANGFVQFRGVMYPTNNASVGNGYTFATIPSTYINTNRTTYFMGGGYSPNSPYTYYPCMFVQSSSSTGALSVYFWGSSSPPNNTPVPLDGFKYCLKS